MFQRVQQLVWLYSFVRAQKTQRLAKKLPNTHVSEASDLGLMALFPNGVTPHVVSLLGQIVLGNDESGIKQELLRLLASPHIFQGLEGEVDFVEDVLNSISVKDPVRQPLIGTLITVESSKYDMALLTTFLPLTGALSCLLDLGMKEVGRSQQKIDIGICLERVGETGKSFVWIPLGRDSCDDVDQVLIFIDHVEEPVPALDGVLITEVPDKERCFVFAPKLLRLFHQCGNGLSHNLAIVGLNRNGISVALSWGAIVVDHRHICRVCSADCWNDSVFIGLDDDYPVDFSL